MSPPPPWPLSLPPFPFFFFSLNTDPLPRPQPPLAPSSVLFQSTAGLAASLVFGSQRDVLTRLRLCSPLSHEHPSQQLTSVPKTPNTAGQGFSRSPTRPGPHRGETDETEDWEREGYEEGNGDGDGDGGETATATTPATTLDGEERKEMGEGEGEAMSMEDMLKFYSRPGDPFSSRP